MLIRSSRARPKGAIDSSSPVLRASMSAARASIPAKASGLFVLEQRDHVASGSIAVRKAPLSSPTIRLWAAVNCSRQVALWFPRHFYSLSLSGCGQQAAPPASDTASGPAASVTTTAAPSQGAPSGGSPSATGAPTASAAWTKYTTADGQLTFDLPDAWTCATRRSGCGRWPAAGAAGRFAGAEKQTRCAARWAVGAGDNQSRTPGDRTLSPASTAAVSSSAS
ncbi:hypothetical protein ABIB51_004068 [Arthrobacter sp. UYCu712]